MFVPLDGGPIRSLHVRLSWLRWVLLGATLCVFSLASGAWMFALYRGSAARVALLERENQGLVAHVSDVAQRLDEIAISVAHSEEQEREARLLAGLDPIDADTRKLGIGGSLSSPSILNELRSPDLAFQVEGQARQLDELERRLEFQNESLSDAISALSERKERLDRTPTVAPLADLTAMSSGFGWRADPFTGEESFHYGLDFRAPEGTPVVATAAGRVVTVEERADYGLTVVIDHGEGVETRYAHLLSSDRRPGDRVARGEVIGAVGNSGRSTGPHVHYEVRINGIAQDPREFIVEVPGGR